MKSELLKEYKGTIPDRCPETKQGEAAYTLVKGLKLFVMQPVQQLKEIIIS